MSAHHSALWWEAVLPEGLLARAVMAYIYSLIAAAWMYYTARKSPPGLQRLFWALPVVLTELAVAPVLIDPWKWPILPTTVSGIFGVAAFKVAAYIMGRGPLVLMDDAPFMQFAAVMCMPVIPASAFKTSGGYTDPSLLKNRPQDFIASYCRKGGLSLCAMAAMRIPGLPTLAVHWLYAFNLSLYLGCLWDVWCLAATVFVGLKVASSFDAPWLSTSFADYWARRWNLTVCYMLRVLVYEPVIEGRFVATPSSNLLAAAASEPGSKNASKESDDKQSNGSKSEHKQSNDKQPTAAPEQGAPLGDADSTAAAAGSRPSSTSSDSTQCDVLVSVEEDTAGTEATYGLEVDGADDSSTLRRRHIIKAAGLPEGKGKGGEVAGSTSSLGSLAADGAAAGVAADQAPQTPAAAAAAGTEDSAVQPAAKAAAGNRAGSVGRAAAAKRPSLLRRYLAAQATFAFSGAWHALIWWTNTHNMDWMGWRWFWFFTIQAPIVAAEAVLIRAAKKRGFMLPRPVAVVLTNFALIVVASPLLFGPCDWSGMVPRMMGNVQDVVVGMWAGLAGATAAGWGAATAAATS